MSTVIESGAAKRSLFADLSVKVKVLTGIAVAVAVAVAVGITGLVALSKASAAAQKLYTSNVASIKAIAAVDTATRQTRLDVALQAISQGAALVASYTTTAQGDMQTAAAAITTYRQSAPAGSPTVIADLESTWQTYEALATNKLLVLGKAKNYIEWSAVRQNEGGPILAKVKQDLDSLNAAETKDAAKNAAAAQSAYRSSRTVAIALLVIGCLVALAVGWLVARRIAVSLNQVKDICQGLAGGDLTRTTGLTSHDEPGEMGRALDEAINRLRRTVATIDQSASSLASASEQMSGTAQQIAASAEQTTAQAQTVSAAAEQISRSVSTVSAGSEEMGASIREISQNATEAAQVAGEAVGLAAGTSTTMNKLGESSAEIGNVIKVITAIAEQTNLLALNATIEAARAGEMGKGFAVVASEVKDLAQETARATEDISRRVQAIQSDTGGAVTAIEEITRVIARISDFQTTIASAVEEQTATTGEMSRSVNEAATGTNEIAENITGVAEAARLTSEGVSQTQQATNELARMSTELTALVGTFKY